MTCFPTRMMGTASFLVMAAFGCRTIPQAEPLNSDHMSSDDSCVGNASDPYEPRLRFKSGITATGKCIDASYRRSIVLLDQFKTDLPDQVRFANLFHKKNFYIAEVDTTAISEVILQLEHFVPFSANAGAHAQIRLRFSKPVAIFSQYKNANGEKVGEVSDLILSYEGLGSKSTGPLDLSPLLQAFDRSSVGIYRITTMHDYVKTFVIDAGNRVEQWTVAIPEEKKTELFKEWALTSNKKGMLSPYHLFDSNCINQMLNALDKLNKGFWQDFRENLTRPFNWYPGFIAQAATAHGIKLTKREDFGPNDPTAKGYF
jgi:hypothetical protein